MLSKAHEGNANGRAIKGLTLIGHIDVADGDEKERLRYKYLDLTIGKKPSNPENITDKLFPGMSPLPQKFADIFPLVNGLCFEDGGPEIPEEAKWTPAYLKNHKATIEDESAPLVPLDKDLDPDLVPA